MKQFTV